MNKIRYKGNKSLHVPFTEDELKAISMLSINTGKTKYQLLREFIFSEEFLTINK